MDVRFMSRVKHLSDEVRAGWQPPCFSVQVVKHVHKLASYPLTLSTHPYVITKIYQVTAHLVDNEIQTKLNGIILKSWYE